MQHAHGDEMTQAPDHQQVWHVPFFFVDILFIYILCV